MTDGVKTIVYPVRDLDRAKALFTELAGTPTTDSPYYVGFDAGGQDIGLDPRGHDQGLTGPLAYFHVVDIAARVKALQAAGAELRSDVRDVGGGKLVATLTDADGNAFGVLQEP